MQTTANITTTVRRLVVIALALFAALAISATTTSQAGAATPKAKAPQAAKHVKVALSKAEQKRLRSAVKSLESNKRAGLDSVSVFCDPYQRASWGYWIRCHVVYVGGPTGYSDWYEYDYWTGRQWAYWFNANS